MTQMARKAPISVTIGGPTTDDLLENLKGLAEQVEKVQEDLDLLRDAQEDAFEDLNDKLRDLAYVNRGGYPEE